MDFKEIADKANEIEEELNLNIDDVLNKLTQEAGEFNDAVQKYRGRYCRNKTDSTENLEKETGDVLINLISVLNRLGINPNQLNKFTEQTLNKFKEVIEDYKKNTK